MGLENSDAKSGNMRGANHAKLFSYLLGLFFCVVVVSSVERDIG